MTSERPFAPSADRNRHAILDALRDELLPDDLVLEFGSGTAQHICHFAEALPTVRWQPTDRSDKLPGMQQWINDCRLPNILPPVELDLCAEPPALEGVTACYSANTLHIISWPLVMKLFDLSAAKLEKGGKLCIYGPFMFEGEHISDGNRQFDRQLRAADPASGIRDVQDLETLARKSGFAPARITAMPANNHLLVWDRCPSTPEPRP
ncbi:DUF938 domain-containing protein [Granulosicoccus sp. 3-233]|uniref:DUF938 domain-containing protein n=1 Tax=Granulosicoccus sp. 3-233 TaxID=3417969 RepID=UPI003D32C06D